MNTVQGYLISQVLHTSWDELRNSLKSVDSLGALIKVHREYLENATKRCDPLVIDDVVRSTALK